MMVEKAGNNSSFPPPNKGEDQGGGVKRHRISPALTRKVRSLRNGLTEAEKMLWYFIRQKQLGGHKFRRQHPIGNYIVDFACVEQKLIIELDGGQHAAQRSYDAIRTSYLEKHGWHVLRFWNNDVLENTEGVLSLIAAHLKDTPPPDLPLVKGRDYFSSPAS